MFTKDGSTTSAKEIFERNGLDLEEAEIRDLSFLCKVSMEKDAILRIFTRYNKNGTQFI